MEHCVAVRVTTDRVTTDRATNQGHWEDYLQRAKAQQNKSGQNKFINISPRLSDNLSKCENNQQYLLCAGKCLVLEI